MSYPHKSAAATRFLVALNIELNPIQCNGSVTA